MLLTFDTSVSLLILWTVSKKIFPRGLDFQMSIFSWLLYFKYEWVYEFLNNFELLEFDEEMHVYYKEWQNYFVEYLHSKFLGSKNVWTVTWIEISIEGI